MKMSSLKKIRKVRKQNSRKKNLNTSREEHNMTSKILQKQIQEHNYRFEKD